MSQQRNNKKESKQIGTFFKRTNKDTGEVITNDKGQTQYSFVLGKDVEITINGKKYDKGYFYVNRPEEKYERMLAAGKITEEEYEEKVARFGKDGDLSKVVFEINRAD